MSSGRRRARPCGPRCGSPTDPVRPRSGTPTAIPHQEVAIDHELDHSFRVVGAPPPRTPRRYAIAARLSSGAFLLGLWLVVSPFALGYGVVGTWFTGHGNEVVTGIVVVVVALTGAMAPADARWSGPVLVAAGAWLAAAPWLIGYRDQVDPTAATVNDLVVGGAVALVGVTVTLVIRPLRTANPDAG